MGHQRDLSKRIGLLLWGFTAAFQWEVLAQTEYGCDAGHTFRLPVSVLRPPSHLWSLRLHDAAAHTPLTAACAGGQGVAVCNLVRRDDPAGNVGNATIAVTASPSAASAVVWRSNHVSSTPLYPLLLPTLGAVISTNGLQLGCVQLGSGIACGDTIYILPSMQPVFETHVTDNGVLMLASTLGPLAGYLAATGIPHASIHFAATVNGTVGFFVPCATPVVNGNLVHVPTEFHPNNGTASLSACRIYSVLVQRTINNRFVVQGAFDYPCPRLGGQPPRTLLQDEGGRLWFTASQNASVSTLLVLNTDQPATPHLIATFLLPASVATLTLIDGADNTGATDIGTVVASLMDGNTLVVFNYTHQVATVRVSSLLGQKAELLPHAPVHAMQLGGLLLFARTPSSVLLVSLAGAAVSHVTWTLQLPDIPLTAHVGQITVLESAHAYAHLLLTANGTLHLYSLSP